MANDLSSLESMLFGLKEVTQDSDAAEVKKEIDRHLTQATEPNAAANAETQLAFVKETVTAVSVSFQKRKAQMLTDAEIVRKINLKIDGFRTEHQLKMDGLLAALMKDIDEAVEDYSSKLIRELDPHKIKEHFSKKEDFEQRLSILNNSYKDKMENMVDRRIQSTIRSYLMDVEDVFETASAYLAERESLMSAEDAFYGSLAHSKSLITRDVRTHIGEMVVYNKSLYEASEELFLKIWAARQEYDRKRLAVTAAGAAVGAVGGAVAGAALGTAMASTVATVGLASNPVGWAIAGGIAVALVGGIAVGSISRKLSAAMFSDQLEENVRLCIEEYRGEINTSKLAMQTHITEGVTRLFDNELKSLDTTFLDFRRATYIDENKIPKLEAKLREIESEAASA